MEKLLVIGGASGTGKTFLRDKLIEEYPEFFYKVDQVTTRPIREDEDLCNYIFASKHQFEQVRKYLFGITEINGEFYGSILAKNSKIGIIILNESGIRDFREKINKNQYKCLYLALDKPIDEIEVRRNGRDTEYLEKERKIRDICDITLTLSNRYATTQEVLGLCKIYL